MGGFARRASYIKSFTRRNPARPSLQVDTGALLAPPAAGDALINKTMLDSLKAFPIDAINLSVEDLYAFAPPAGRSEPSIAPPFVSANIAWKAKPVHDLPPYIIKTVSLPTARGPKPWRVGITGVADAATTYSEKAFTLSDPLAAAQRVVQELRPRCDWLVLLSDMPHAPLAELARQVRGIDVIVYSEKNPFPKPPERVNDTFLLGTSLQGRSLGELSIYLDGEGEISRYRARYIGLDSGIPDDPELEALVASTRRSLAAFHKERASAPASPVRKPLYAGSARCLSCHEAAHAVWRRSAHARAMDTLKAKGQEFNPLCVRCHSTGFGVAGGFLNMLQTPDLAHVHCEACHGPGLAHVQAPSQRLAPLTSSVCLPCHTSVDSPNFDFAKAWDRIKH